MRKYLIILPFLFSTYLLSAQEDKKESIFQPALIVGFNATQVNGDNLAGYRKMGANVGAAAYIHLPKNLSVNFEILYSQKGSKSGTNELFTDNTKTYRSYKLIMDYVDIPILLNYHDKDAAIFGIGLVYTNLIRYKEFRGDYEFPSVNPYKTAGVEFLLNVIFVFKKKIGMNLRYTYSLSNTRKIPTDYPNGTNFTQRNNVLSLRAMYFF